MALAFGVAAAVVRDMPGLVALLGGGGTAVAVARPPRAFLIGLVRILVVLAGAAVLLNAFFTPGIRLPGPSQAPLWPTTAGVREGIETALRLVSMACVVFALIATTSPRQLAEAADSALGRLPAFRGAGLAVNVACRFFPDIVQEVRRMRLIRSVRMKGRRLSIWSRLSEAGSMMLVLVVIVVRRAERVADAVTSRCFESGAPRTAWRPRRFTSADGVALAATFALCACALLLGVS
jgi:energy-coupling factor transporter transmembrane protein EcfT